MGLRRLCCSCCCATADDETARLATALIEPVADGGGDGDGGGGGDVGPSGDGGPAGDDLALVEEMKARLGWAALALDPVVSAMAVAYGGEPYCFQRFIAARGDQVDAAVGMFLATARWRREHALHHDARPEDAAVADLVGPLWPGRPCGSTADGSPMNYFRFGHLDPRALMRLVPSETDLASFYISFMETTLTRQNAANPPGAGSAAWRAMVEVYDFRGIGLHQLHLPGLRRLSRVLSIGQSHYPENARKIVMINVPTIFYAGWSVVSPVLDVRTREKVEIYADDGLPRLRAIVGGGAHMQALQALILGESDASTPGAPGSATDDAGEKSTSIN